MAVLTYIPEILEEHFEELAFLLHLRAVQVNSNQMLRRQLVDLDERLEGHIQGLLAVPEGTEALAAPHLAGKDPLNLRAAAYILLRLGLPGAVEKCLALLENPALMPAVSDALLLRKAPEMLAGLKKVAAGPASPAAAAATEILAQHFPQSVNANELGKQLTDPEPAVRAGAWRAAARLGAARPAAQYQVGIQDADAGVKLQALFAAAWAGQKMLLTQARMAAQKPTPAALPLLQLFAVVAEAGDAPLIVGLAKADALGPARFDVLARSGFPAAAPALLAAMKVKDPATAAAAGAAFLCLTGFDPFDGTRVPLAKSNDPFEQAFADEAAVPNPTAAETFWNGPGAALAALPRIARGIAVDPAAAPVAADLMHLDCRAFVDVHLRHYFQTGQCKRSSELLA